MMKLPVLKYLELGAKLRDALLAQISIEDISIKIWM